MCLIPSEALAQAEDAGLDGPASCRPPTTITLSWEAPSFQAAKGIVHAPYAKPAVLEGNGLAAPLRPRLFNGGGAQKARPDARLREERRRARLSHRSKRCRAEAESRFGSQGGVTGMPRPTDRAATG
jgi:hypothetical protein